MPKRYLLLLLPLIAALFLLPGIVKAQDGPKIDPESCTECHANTVKAWQDSKHATTQEANAPGCETCHGDRLDQHPPAPAAIPTNAELCGQCHTTTYSEWQSSKHGQQQLACVTCHYPHPQQIRFESVTTLCLNCHNEARDNFIHVQHLAQSCTDCHWYRQVSGTDKLVASVMPTGHDNRVSVAACTACHEGLQTSAAPTPEATPDHPLRVAFNEISTLEAQVSAAREAGAGNAGVRLLQGGILGLALGAVLTVGFIRYRKLRSIEE